MTRSEARKTIKAYVPTKYSNSTEMLLLRLVDLTFRGTESADSIDRPIKATTESLAKAARVQPRQLAYLLKQLSQDGVLLDTVCGVRHTSCRLDLAPLNKLEAYSEKHKAEKQTQGQARTEKSRARRETVRELSMYVAATTQALNADLLDFAVKQSLLQDVDAKTRRVMQNWPVERIQKHNAEAALAADKKGKQ